jgi:hypothetical protein
MRTTLESISPRLGELFELLRRTLCDADFIAGHRVRAQDFTRHRQLTFPVVMLFVLQKTIKSIQRHLHEFLDELAQGQLFEPVTPGAITHARAKLKHTAFIELNEVHVLQWVYAPEHASGLRLWREHRLLGMDSSLVRLPNSEELREHFSLVETENKLGKTGISYPEGRMSVLYDLLNRVALNGRLEPSSLSEVALATEQLKQAQRGDVLIHDRGFTGYGYLAWHNKLGRDYIGRCSTGSFAAAQELFRKNRAGQSLVVKLMAPAKDRAELRELGLPTELKARFVSVRLPTGELEVLVTSLLDEEKYPTAEFIHVYHWRWGHETFYGTIKGRLDLENFSGQTLESVQQDFHATLLLSNLETVLTQDTQKSLAEQSQAHQHPKQVNHAVAFHALKDQVLELFYSDTPIPQVILKLQQMFRGSPVSVRPERKPPRRKRSLNRSYQFQRNVRKIVF